jgi:hypothetical protein
VTNQGNKTLVGGSTTFNAPGPAAGNTTTFVAKYVSDVPTVYSNTESNTQPVAATGGATTSSTLTGPATATYGGAAMTFAINVTSLNPIPPTGTAKLFIGSVVAANQVGSEVTLVGGTANFSIPVPNPGSVSYIAHYYPTGSYTGSDSNSVTTVVAKATPTITITAGPTDAKNNKPDTYTIHVAGAAGKPNPTGSATCTVKGNLDSGNTTVTGGTLDASGNTSFYFTNPKQGTGGVPQVVTVTFNYAGNSLYGAATQVATAFTTT